MLCIFDVNETLLDLAALDEFFDEVTGTPRARQEWFSLMIHSALTLTAARAYRPFGEIGAACLPPVAARHGRAVTRDHQRELGERMRRLPAHPDAGAAMRSLRDSGFGVVTLTNSTAEVAEDQLRNAGLRGLVQAVYSADEVRMLKPAPRALPPRLGRPGRHPPPGRSSSPPTTGTSPERRPPDCAPRSSPATGGAPCPHTRHRPSPPPACKPSPPS